MSQTSPLRVLALASDHAGVDLRKTLGEQAAAAGWTLLDLGTDGPASVDYPDYATAVADALKDGRAALGLLICGTGIGISIAANRHRHVRAALCHSTTDARLTRQHNDANVLVLGARTTGIEIARDILAIFLATAYEGGRHQRRIDKMS